MTEETKKQILLNLPYLFFVYFFDKIAQGFRLSYGADLGAKLLYFPKGLSEAFSSPLISFHLSDLFIGIITAALIRLAVYVKGKNAKKYRKGTEYGSARFGNKKDINRSTGESEKKPSIREQLKEAKKQSEQKKHNTKTKNHELEV